MPMKYVKNVSTDMLVAITYIIYTQEVPTTRVYHDSKYPRVLDDGGRPVKYDYSSILNSMEPGLEHQAWIVASLVGSFNVSLCCLYYADMPDQYGRIRTTNSVVINWGFNEKIS